MHKAFIEGKIKRTTVTMHFVTTSDNDQYDDGPVFFQYPIPLQVDDTPESIGERANKIEHEWQARITHMVIHGHISWDGRSASSLQVPLEYTFHKPVSLI